MTRPRSRSVALPAVALLLLALVVGDVTRRALSRGGEGPGPAAPSALAPSAPAPSRGTGQPASRIAGDSASHSMAATVAATDRLDSATREAALARIGREGMDTYLPVMLSTDDSALHRWADERATRPIRVGILREPVPGFREVFAANVAWAITRWNAVGLPIYLEQIADTAGADIAITWADRLDSNRAGRADVTWQRTGPLVHVHVTLATHTPDGSPVLPAQMVALALHELGHALGLGHSPAGADALHAETSALDLTARDRRTALLLYALPAGSLK